MNTRSGIICAGNWIVDLIHEIAHWPNESELVRIGRQSRGIGGGAANVVAALAKLQTGLPLFPMGAVGDDEHGAFILSECEALGLPISELATKSGIATAHTHVMSVAGQSRTFFYHGGANDVLGPEDFPSGTFAASSAKVFYLGYLTLLGRLDETEPGGITNAAKVLARAQKANLITCVDLVSMPHPKFPEIVSHAAPYLDYLVTNEIEAALALGCKPSVEADAIKEMAHGLRELGMKRAVIVHCAERVVWLDVDGTAHMIEASPLPPDEIVSTLGAGDAFCAGLLYGIHENLTPERTIQIANAAARASLKGWTATSAIPPLRALNLDH